MTTAPNTQDEQDPTPPEAEQTGTTPPQAEKKGTTQSAAENAEPEERQERVEDIVKKRLDRAREQWEAEKAEAERKARLDEAERLKEENEEAARKLEEAEARALRAERRATLTGKVADPQAALRLLDDDKHLTDDGEVNVDALLESYPFLMPADERRKAPVNPANAANTKGMPTTNPWATETRNLTEQARIMKENPGLAQQLKQAAGM